ncbi:MAG TPA: tyrosine-type recombinase/integrase [Gemmatimonadales bacterium]|nr:tyrosine-type recombinase/integrase [Gemmatimonadales bacterium]
MKTFRLEKRYPGIGPVRVMTDLTDPSEITEFKGLMESLARSRPVLVSLFRAKKLTARDLLRASREERLGALLPDERLLIPIADAFESAWKLHERRKPHTTRRYRTSSTKLLKVLPALGMPALSLVQDLAAVSWEEVAERWPDKKGREGKASAADWMHCYRMVSRFLTLHLGGGRKGRLHQWRAEVLDLLPRKRERKRIPNIAPAVFGRVVKTTPDYLQPSYMALVITGFRLGEFLACNREHLRPDVFELEVPGSKTEEGEAVVPIEPALWHWIDKAIPCPVGEWALRYHWQRACEKEGLKWDWLHDLRHCHAQWCINEKVPEAMVQASLRHTDASTTRRYTLQQMRQEPAAAIARVLARVM